MIYIYLDLECIESVQPDDYTWIAEHFNDYVPLRKHLRVALDDSDRDFKVYVRSALLVGWLQDLRAYGERTVKWETLDLRHRFQSQIKVRVPPELDSATIQALDLLLLTPPSHLTDEEFVNWLLGQRLDPIWDTLTPSAEHLVDLCAWVVSTTKTPHTALALLQQRCLAHWSAQHSSYAYLLKGDLRAQAASVLVRWALRQYPPVFLRRINLDSAPLLDCSHSGEAGQIALKPYAKRISAYWAKYIATSPSDSIQSMLSTMSGLLEVELTVLVEQLRRKASQLSQNVLAQMRQRFASLPTMPAMLEQLTRLMPAKLPSEPSMDWKIARWLEWATDEYLPYFAWVIRTDQPRELQMALANRFSDWLTDQSPHMPFDNRAPVLTNQREIVRELWQANTESILLWIIIDGLTWWQGRLLAQVCTEHSLAVSILEPWLSMLPSVTTVSKRALVQGNQTAKAPHRALTTVLQEQLATLTAHVQVSTSIEKLAWSIVTDVQPGIYALLYNGLDSHNHESTSFTDDEAVTGHLRKIARHLAEINSHCQTHGRSWKAVISSDHGSTLLSSTARNLEPPAQAVHLDDEDDEATYKASNDATIRRTRALMLAHPITAFEVKKLSIQWYVLPGDVFGLQQTFLIPRGYDYSGRRPRGWTHGGATPEEVVVPFLHIIPEALTVIEPSLVWSGHLWPAKASEVEVNVTNPNAFPLKQVSLVIWDGQYSASIKKIDAQRTESIVFKMPPATERGQTQTINWILSWEVGGRVHQTTGDARIAVRRLQITQPDPFQELT